MACFRMKLTCFCFISFQLWWAMNPKKNGSIPPLLIGNFCSFVPFLWHTDRGYSSKECFRILSIRFEWRRCFFLQMNGLDLKLIVIEELKMSMDMFHLIKVKDVFFSESPLSIDFWLLRGNVAETFPFEIGHVIYFLLYLSHSLYNCVVFFFFF